MKILLLDTNIVSFMFKSAPHAAAYRPYLQGSRQAVSFMTIAELYQWAFVHNWGERRLRELEQTFHNYTVFLANMKLCRLWADVRTRCRKAGRPISPQDAWIAATALQYNIPLVTHNPDDFEPIEELDIITTIRRQTS